MNVEGGILGFAGELAEAVVELLLEVIGEVVLGAEEDDAALGDWGDVRQGEEDGKVDDILVIARSRSNSSAFGAFNKSSTMLMSWNSVPMTWVVLDNACTAL